MFNVRFTIVNPWHHGQFNSIWSKWANITENKRWEIEICKNSSDILLFDVDICWRGSDHAGPSILLGLFSYFIHVKIYDRRHWNYDANTWEEYTECEETWN